MRPQTKQHFSHHHILLPLQPEHGKTFNCRACDNPISEPFHGCLSCNFHLHGCCADAPRSLNHPSHPSHPLTLAPTPTYPSGSFTCNACSLQGRAYSFSCACCEYDLHVQCALMPKTTESKEHPSVTAIKEENSEAINAGREGSDQESEKTMFEAQRELKEQMIAHKLMLQALDNASDYVGPSYGTRYYYY
ncbi:probable nucleoredoxin 1 [Phtheirospermum japonicum]|uniref:Probable nucleoredoxin 1 n=1 Tax=Phtheirospermum japonicum TaxID=374723 RepID=A0A830CX88_9LAMI|nr:probable nucleoredoxin 1 [Phtheirospermum japonicum]